jgi:hypothetical protein
MHATSTDPRSGAESWFLPVVGLLVALCIAYAVGALQSREEMKRGLAPHQHAKSAADAALGSCGGKQGDDLVSCVEERIAKAEETARSEQDLTAQQQSAWGSMISAGAALIAAATTLLGLVWIKSTLDATRETAKAAVDANRIANEHSRGWLAVEITRMGPIRRSVLQSDFHIEVAYRLKNAGNSPVTNLSDSVVVMRPSKGGLEKEELLLRSIAGRRSSGIALGLAPGDMVEREFAATFSIADLHSGRLGLMNTVLFEAWVGAEYTTRGMTGSSVAVSTGSIQLPFAAVSLSHWSGHPNHRQVGAMMT